MLYPHGDTAITLRPHEGGVGRVFLFLAIFGYFPCLPMIKWRCRGRTANRNCLQPVWLMGRKAIFGHLSFYAPWESLSRWGF